MKSIIDFLQNCKLLALNVGGAAACCYCFALPDGTVLAMQATPEAMLATLGGQQLSSVTPSAWAAFCAGLLHECYVVRESQEGITLIAPGTGEVLPVGRVQGGGWQEILRMSAQYLRVERGTAA
jgi:hypothetical protein